MFSIYDVKVDAYADPFLARSSEEAKRMVIMAAKGGDNNLSTWPGDFTLFEVGSWDQDHGQPLPLQTPHNHGTVLQILAAEEGRKDRDRNREQQARKTLVPTNSKDFINQLAEDVKPGIEDN